MRERPPGRQGYHEDTSCQGVKLYFTPVSEKHLDRYLDELTYRFNGRDDGQLFQRTLRNLINGKTLTFEQLTKIAEKTLTAARQSAWPTP